MSRRGRTLTLSLAGAVFCAAPVWAGVDRITFNTTAKHAGFL